MYKLTYLQKAMDDLGELYLYISQNSGQAADKMISKTLTSIKNLETFPFAGSSVNDKMDVKGNYRIIIVKPYLVFYRIIENDVIIYRVLHERRYYQVLLD